MNSEKKEIREAIVAGERALTSLYAAQDLLQSARGWGMFDMFGGGLFSSMIKRGKMNDAANCMEEAKRHLMVFQYELQDVNISANLNMEIGSFLSFADFFFDGFVADYLVQTKIADAAEQVDDAIYMVTNILNSLRTTV